MRGGRERRPPPPTGAGSVTGRRSVATGKGRRTPSSRARSRRTGRCRPEGSRCLGDRPGRPGSLRDRRSGRRRTGRLDQPARRLRCSTPAADRGRSFRWRSTRTRCSCIRAVQVSARSSVRSGSPRRRSWVRRRSGAVPSTRNARFRRRRTSDCRDTGHRRTAVSRRSSGRRAWWSWGTARSCSPWCWSSSW